MIFSKYLNNETFETIGKRHNMSRQAVEQRVKKGFTKIKELVNES